MPKPGCFRWWMAAPVSNPTRTSDQTGLSQRTKACAGLSSLPLILSWPPLQGGLLTGPSEKKDHLKASAGASISISRAMALLGHCHRHTGQPCCAKNWGNSRGAWPVKSRDIRPASSSQHHQQVFLLAPWDFVSPLTNPYNHSRNG